MIDGGIWTWKERAERKKGERAPIHVHVVALQLKGKYE